MDWDNPEHIAKALLFLYQFQTADERIAGQTVYDNSVGFNAVDAPILTDIALFIVQKHKVSEAQLSLVKAKILKYKGQLGTFNPDRILLPSGFSIFTSTREKTSDGTLGIHNDVLHFRPFVYPSAHIKGIASFGWEKPYWKLHSVSPDVIEKVLEMFPSTEVHESVTEYLAQITQFETKLYHEDLFEYQRQSVSFMVKFPQSMLALAPGLGKTVAAIMACKEVGGKTLIVSPLSLTRNWQREIHKWTGEESQIWHQTLGTTKTNWVITNYESILNLWISYDIKKRCAHGKTVKTKINWQCMVDHDFSNLIIDESIMVKNRKAMRTQAVKAIAPTFNSVWLLSGSPTSRFYDDMWSQLNILNPRRFSAYWKFAKEYCHVEQSHWGWKIVANQQDAATRINKDLRDVYFSRTQDQVLNLPDWLIENYNIDMGKEQTKMYDEMQRTFVAELPDGDVLLAPNILAQMMRLVQIASSPKLIDADIVGTKWTAIDEILEFVQLPTIIWTSFIATAEHLYFRLQKSYRCKVLTGKTKSELRQDHVDAFQNGDVDILIAHPGVGKFGFTLTAARTAIYLERSYNGDDYYQSLHRVRRIGTEHSPHVIHMLACYNESGAGTIDHVIDKVLSYRKDSNFKLTSGLVRDLIIGE